MKKAIIYLILFAAAQLTVQFAVTIVLKLWFPGVNPLSSTPVLISSAVSNILLLALFLFTKKCPVSRHYVRTKPWATLIWTALLAVGMILPLTFLEEFIPESLRMDVMGETMVEMIKTTEGYFVICMLAPLAEEVVFRGAMIRALREWAEKRWPAKASLIAVILSACFFALIHFNPAQIPHALLVGCLLGWLFVKTGSIVPGVILHWINNSAAYVIVMLYPNLPLNANLIDIFHGNTTTLYQAIGFSLMIALPSLYQLYVGFNKR